LARNAAAAEQLSIAEDALAAGRFLDAAEVLRKAIKLDRESPRPQLMLGYALWQAGQRGEAIRVLRRLIQRSPANADAWFNLGNFYRGERRLEEAAAAFRRAAQLRPDNAAAHVNLAYALAQEARFDEAEAALRASLQRFPAEPDLLVNLAQIQRATRRWSEAAATLERCLALAPQHPGYRVTRALVHLDAGETKEALAALDGIIRDHPEFPDAHFARAQLLLGQREYAEGWREYLWRPARARWLAAQGQAFSATAPALEAIRGKPVTLCGEQGLGDVLFFLRFAPLVEPIAESVHVEVDARLKVMLPSGWLSPSPSNAVRILLGDLPAMAGSDPVPSLSLSPDPARVAEARQRLAECGAPPYLAVTWQGGVLWEDMGQPGAGLFKRVPPAALGRALSSKPGSLISVQRGALKDDLAQLSAAAQRKVHDFSDVNADLPAALAVLSLLDDYVAVSNTNVHLNDALGRRSRVLVTTPAEWRWCIEGERSPWLTHATLYRQALDGTWDRALARLEEDLPA
jgi:tetratricopeptide (TPR) repeat protein